MHRLIPKRTVNIFICLAMSSLVGGCHDSNSGRMTLRGTVTLDGQPLEKAVIGFFPLPGTNSPTAGADVVDGQFEVPAHVSVFPGRFRVTVTASRLTGRKISDPRWNKMMEEQEQYLPARYNEQSELEIEVGGENGRAPLEFELVSK